jgi:hypothetical protein
MKRTIRIAAGEVTLQEDGLIYATAYPGAEVSLPLAVEYHEIVSYLSEERAHATVLDISGLTYMSKEAREWLRDASSAWGRTVSVALITNSYTSKIIGNLFLSASRPSYPIRLFTSADAATEWSRENYRTYIAGLEEVGCMSA